MTKPTPFFVLALVAIVLSIITVTIVFTAHNAAMDRQAERILNPQMCVSESGHKKVPCPEEYNR